MALRPKKKAIRCKKPWKRPKIMNERNCSTLIIRSGQFEQAFDIPQYPFCEMIFKEPNNTAVQTMPAFFRVFWDVSLVIEFALLIIMEFWFSYYFMEYNYQLTDDCWSNLQWSRLVSASFRPLWEFKFSLTLNELTNKDRLATGRGCLGRT